MWVKRFGLFVRIVLLLQLFYLAPLSTPHYTPLRAQAPGATLLTDCTTFPTCRIYVPTTAAATQPTLLANGQPVATENYTVQQEEVGVAVAFALHEYARADRSAPSVHNPGQTGEARFVEFRKTAINFVDYAEKAAFDINKYWLAAYKTGDSPNDAGFITDFPAIVDWVRGDFRNTFLNNDGVGGYAPPEGKNTPSAPLYDLIDHTITTFDVSGSPTTGIAKEIVVITNGVLDGGDLNNETAATRNQVTLPALLAHAAEQRVKIHVLLSVGKANAGALAETLRGNAQALAGPTGGQVIWLGEAPVDGDAYAALTPLWEQIGQDRLQQVITVDLLKLAAAGIAPASLQVNTGDAAQPATPALPPFQPPQVISPTVAPPQWTGAEALTLQFGLTWPDGYENPTRLSVLYRLQDGAGNVISEHPDTEEPLTAMTISGEMLSNLTDGSYTVLVQLTDQLLPTAPISMPVGSFVVARPTPEPTVTPTVAVSPTAPAAVATSLTTTTPITALAPNTTGPGSAAPTPAKSLPFTDIGEIVRLLQPFALLIWSAAGLVLLLLTIGFWRRWRDSRRQVDVIRTSDPPGDHTLPDDQTEPDVEGFPVVRLIYEVGDGNLLPEIPLYPSNGSENRWSIGRSFQERDCYINHPRVSRLHAVLIERNGQYYLRHEGASGGTYVNRVPLTAMKEEKLHDGDLLHFSTAVAYRFRIEAAQPQANWTEPDLGATPLDGNATEGETIG